MSLTLSIAVYFVIWWTVLFAVLPLGVRTQGESGDVVPGTPASAPVAPRLKRVVLITTIAAAVIFALIWSIVFWQLIDLGRLPGPGGAGR